MLNEEQAEKRLQEFRQQEEWVDQRLTRVDKLPKTLRESGRILLRMKQDGKRFSRLGNRQSEKFAEKFVEQFSKMGPKQRSKLIASLFPKIGSIVERAWGLQQRLPYQHGWERKAFRAPHSPEITLPHFAGWLSSVVDLLEGYPEDIRWIAAWTPHLGGYNTGQVLGQLLAAAIDEGGPQADEVVQILKDSASNEHEVGIMGRHVVKALLCCSRSDCWEFIEKLLLAAQRQEGLRQTILESIDEAHPEAFRRMLSLILEHNLVRFSATVRAVDVWIGLLWDSASTGVVKKLLEQIVQSFDDPAAREAALAGDDAEAAYLALWTIAFHDGIEAIGSAEQLMKDADPEKRFAAVHLLTQLMLPQARLAAMPALADEDLRVTDRALDAVTAYEYYSRDKQDEVLAESDLFERLEKEIGRFPQKKTTLKPILWPWVQAQSNRDAVTAAMIRFLGKRDRQRLVQYIPDMGADTRAQLVQVLSQGKKLDAATRDTLFQLVGDASSYVRQQTLEQLKKCTLTADEAVGLEGLMTRKANDLRRGVLTLLVRQKKDNDVLASAGRLLDSKSGPQRLAGLELLRSMIEAERSADKCRARAAEFQESRKRISKEEQSQLETLLDSGREVPTLENALGLMDPAARTKPPTPKPCKVQYCTKAAIACLKSLHDLVEKHRETTVTLNYLGGEREELLGNISGWAFPSPIDGVPIEEDVKRLLLADVWEEWYQQRPKKLRDADGLELLRASLRIRIEEETRPSTTLLKQLGKTFTDDRRLPKTNDDYLGLAETVFHWLMRLHPAEGGSNFLLDGLENGLSLVVKALPEIDRISNIEKRTAWRNDHPPIPDWLHTITRYPGRPQSDWQPDHTIRFWQLMRFIDEPGIRMPRDRCDVVLTLQAYTENLANEHDVMDHLLGPRTEQQQYYSGRNFDELSAITSKKPPKEYDGISSVKEWADKCRERILEVELERGEQETEASSAALAIRSLSGTETLVRLIEAMGKTKFLRGYNWGNESRGAVFSHLIRVTTPEESDTPADFAKHVKQAEISETRLLDVAMYSPQWAKHVETALNWPGLEEAVWWIHAHTKDDQWSVEEHVRESWTAAVSQRTPLTAEDLVDGGVDVDWFSRTYAQLKKARWGKVIESAKYASGSGGHKRAQLFAEAMLGIVKKKDVITRINEKRHQDSVRALGLLPFAKGKAREKDLLTRYQTMQEFIRTSRQFGSQRQASEKRAANIGMENLARTAGYPDPLRLQWAMEAHEIADLAAGPVSVTAGGVTVTLAIDPGGMPDLSVQKKDRTLKSIPAAARKNPKVIELRDRRTALKRQASRMRISLEQAMCRGDQFGGDELKQLFEHPVLSPMLARLALVGEGIMGFPVKAGRALEDFTGTLEPIKKAEQIRIAHPHDLLKSKKWHKWQQDCFQRERVQPFKQIFRELYVVTAAEKKEKTISRRYAGHQVHPSQAMALLGNRGWVSAPEEGVCRTFHDENLTAWVEFQEAFYTPADIEGLTLEGLRFSKRGEYKPLPLTKVPPRIFSEVMRDMDLVVSVAHRGRVDPEASASTIEMRSALLSETCSLLNLKNVRVKDNHVLIKGQLCDYSVHLGSAVAHRQPGGMLFVVAVHSQHRGRLFLPFADDDPKTAEVLSKVILLSRDDKIQDPNLLDQIRAKD